MTVRALMFGLLVVAMVAVGCSGDDDDAATPTTTAPATTVAPSVTEAATTTTTTTTSVQETEVSTTTVPSAEVVEGAFTFADDDLCEWVSEDEVAEFVAAEYEWDGTAVLEGAGGTEDADSCQWILTSTAGDDAGSVWAGNATSTSDNDFSKRHIADFDAEVGSGYVREGGSAVSGHPSLSDGVVVYAGPPLSTWCETAER